MDTKNNNQIGCVLYAAIFVLFTGIPQISLSFQADLSGIKKYAAAQKEFPEPDKPTDWNDPNYKTYLTQITPTIFDRFLQAFRTKNSSQFDPNLFKKQLGTITSVREAIGYKNKYVTCMRCKPKTNVFLWGDLHGAFHSLVRALTFLHGKNIIDNQLKIVDEQTYFIFNGDVIDRSPYGLETLSLILLLLEKNPEQVIYIRGNHEYQNYWYNFSLKRELMIRMYQFEKDSNNIPLGDLVSRFFNTLPLALYLSTSTPTKNVIRISHFGLESRIIEENKLGNLFIEASDQPFTYYDLDKKLPTATPVNVKIIIKKEDWMREHRATTGLGFLDQSYGATAWSVISCPIQAYQKLYNFYYDAFVLLNPENPLENSTITLYQNDIRKSEGFKVFGMYNLYTGALIKENEEPPQLKNDISLGSSMALVGGVASMGIKTKLGLSLKINQENQQNGINLHPIHAFILNDNYTPSLARKNIIHLLEKNIDLILLPVGTPTLSAYLDYVTSQKILVLFPITGAPQFRSPELKGLVNFRASYADEVRNLIDYEVNTLGARKFAFFYQDDSYGLGPLQAAHEALKKYGFTQWTDVAYTRNASDLQKQAQAILAAQPDAIGFFSTGNQTEEVIRRLGIESIANKKLFGISFLAEESFRIFVKSHGIPIIFGAVVPNPNTSQLQIVREYRDAMDTINHTYDIFSLEGYIATSILVDVIKQLPGEINKQTILEKIQSLKGYPFKGLTLTFNPNLRNLSQPVWLEIGENVEWSVGKIS